MGHTELDNHVDEGEGKHLYFDKCLWPQRKLQAKLILPSNWLGEERAVWRTLKAAESRFEIENVDGVEWAMVMTYQPSVGEFAFRQECLRQERKLVEKVQVEWRVRVMVVGKLNAHFGRDCTCDGHVGLQGGILLRR